MSEPGATAVQPPGIRPPLTYYLIMIVYLCTWSGGAVAFALAHRGLATIVFLALLGLIASFLTYRLARLSVTCLDDSLLVRNQFRTYRVARAEIEGFRIGRKVNRPGTIILYARLRDGTVLPLDVSWQFFYFDRGMPLEDQIRVLQTWLSPAALT